MMPPQQDDTSLNPVDRCSPKTQYSSAGSNGLLERRNSFKAHDSSSLHAPATPLSPISANAMNTIKIVPSSQHPIEAGNGNSSGDLTPKPRRPSADFTTTLNVDECVETKSATQTALSSSTSKANSSNLAHQNQDRSPGARPAVVPSTSIRMISSEFGPTRSFSGISIPEDSNASNTAISPQQWSSAVGRANLGKSGRVIERLMAESDMLKRDLQIERLRAEEAKQAMKMTEGKMDAMSSDYEGRLHDAAINKTLLKRRERQLTELKAQIDGERQRADAAAERERGWKKELEKTEIETKQRVDEATNFALLMEGRNNTLTSHWKEQGDLIKSTAAKFNAEVFELIQQRQADCRRMDLLQEMCNKQKDQLTVLQEEKRHISEAFEAYKIEQECLFKAIKSKAFAQEESGEQILKAMRMALGDLKWALGVKQHSRVVQ